MAGRERHLRDVGDVPGADDVAAAVGVAADLLDDLRDLVDVPAVRSRPAAPLVAVDRPEVAVLVGPLVPDRDATVLQPLHVGVAAQEPQQLREHRPGVDLLRGDQREALRPGRSASGGRRRCASRCRSGRPSRRPRRGSAGRDRGRPARARDYLSGCRHLTHFRRVAPWPRWSGFLGGRVLVRGAPSLVEPSERQRACRDHRRRPAGPLRPPNEKVPKIPGPPTVHRQRQAPAPRETMDICSNGTQQGRRWPSRTSTPMASSPCSNSASSAPAPRSAASSGSPPSGACGTPPPPTPASPPGPVTPYPAS